MYARGRDTTEKCFPHTYSTLKVYQTMLLLNSRNKFSCLGQYVMPYSTSDGLFAIIDASLETGEVLFK